MIKKIKESLMLKIFLIVSALLILISAITYAAVARFLPVTYANRLKEDLDAASQKLVRQIEQHSSLEEAEGLIALFEAGSKVSVTILDQDGTVVRRPAEVTVAVEQETDWVQYEDARVTYEYKLSESGNMASVRIVTDADVDSRQEGASQAESSQETDAFQTEGSQEADVSRTDVARQADVSRTEGSGETDVPRTDVARQADTFLTENSKEAADRNADVTQTEVVQAAGDVSVTGTAADDDSWVAEARYLLDMDGAIVNLGVALKEYGLKMNGENYTMQVSGGMQPVNQAVEVLKEIFPYILLLVLTASLLIAFGASRYLTKLKDEIELERELDRQHLAFFSAVSHELKTPVTILEGHLTGMLEGVGEYQNREYYLKRSLRTVQNMRGMVGELLTVSRIEGKPPAMQQTDLAELLRLQLAECTEWIEQRGLELTADLPEHCWWQASPPMMEKVFRNLLTNAIRYTPGHAGNQIRIRMEEGEADRSLFFCIENTGASIPPENLPHLFEAFYRVEQSRNRETGGSGLGLYIVRMILDQHGAQYKIENTADGVAFSVDLRAA